MHDMRNQKSNAVETAAGRLNRSRARALHSALKRVHREIMADRFWFSFGAFVVASLTATLWLPEAISAEGLVRAANLGTAQPATVDVVEGEEAARNDPTAVLRQQNEKRYAESAIVVTRPELEELMRRAEAFAKDNSFRNAVVLWGRVLEEGGSSLTTIDAETYVPLVDRVEEAISQLPADGLAAYRIIADGEATALMAQSDKLGREAALSSVVERHFMSNLGDQAAFELAGLMLDRFDFVTATRLLEKIVTRHPDPDVPAGELHLRRAVAWAALGDQKQSKAAFELAVTARPSVEPELLESVSKYLSNSSNFVDRVSADVRWGMPFGNSRRDGVMPRLPEEFFAGDLMVADSVELDSMVSSEPITRVLRMFGQNGAEQGNAAGEAISRGTTNNWLPAQRAVLGPNGLLVKGSRTPYFFRANDQGKIEKVWESLWHNMYLVDDATVAERVNLSMYGAQATGGNKPSSPTEIFLYADLIHQSMAIIGDTAFVVEGQPFDRGRNFPTSDQQVNQGFFGPQSIRRSRTNWLTAYNVKSGRLLWTRAARDSELTGGAAYEGTGGFDVPELAPDPSTPQAVPAVDQNGAAPVEAPGQAAPQVTGEPATPAAAQQNDGIGPDGLPLIPDRGNVSIVNTGVGYMGNPVLAGGVLVLPLSESGSMHLQAISPETGKTLWRTPLCDAPSNGAPNFSPVHIAVDGQDLYVTCGMGLLFAINSVDGRVRFARRYDRDSLTAPPNPNNGWGNQMPQSPRFKGWSEDVVIPFQGVVVVATSDGDRLSAFDRTTGSFIWSAPRMPFSEEMEYLLGVRGRFLYSAGRQSILCYDLQGQGKLVWREEFTGESLGRGCMTETGIFMPVAGSIAFYSYDPIPGTRNRKVAQVGVRGLGERTVGNLYSDGKNLWSISAARLMLLAPATAQLNTLEEQSEAGDPRATWERALLAIEAGQADLAERLATLTLQQWQSRTVPPTPASNEPVEVNSTETFVRRLSDLSFLELAEADSTRALAALKVLGVVASSDAQDELSIDPVSLQRSRSTILRLAKEAASEWNIQSAAGWGHLLWQFPGSTEKMAFAEALSPGRSQRDWATSLLGSSDPGRVWLGLAWLDGAGVQQSTDRLSDLVESESMPDLIKARALERLIQARSSQVPQLVAQALSQWSDAQARLRVLRAFERSTSEIIDVDVLASANDRDAQVASWLSKFESRGVELSWRDAATVATERFDRLLVGFPNQGLVAEVSHEGEIVREMTCESMVAVAADELGNRWIAYPDRLEYRDVDGNVLVEQPLSAYPKGIAVREGGEVWLALGGLPGNVLIFRDFCKSTDVIETSGESLDALAVWDADSFLVALSVSGRLERWNASGDVREALPLSFVSGVTRLDSGHVLATSSLNGSVHELDETFRPLLRRSQLPQARAAARTADGLTVVAYSQGVVALNEDAQEVWAIRDHGPAITLAYF